jgi:hypothetical protein
MVRDAAMPHVIELAPTGRAKCRGCQQPIAKGDFRFGERIPNVFADAEGAESTLWFHLRCAACKRPEPFLPTLEATEAAIPDRDWLIHEAQLGLAHRRVARVDAASRAPSGRAACRHCKEPIPKGTWRIGLVFYEDGRFAPSGYIHARCTKAYLETTEILPRVRHFSAGLGNGDEGEIAQEFGS